MKNNIKFEEAVSKLEEAVRQLESGGISLDEAISIYEEAVGLVKICHDRLESARQKVKLITEGADGAVTDRPFTCNEN